MKRTPKKHIYIETREAPKGATVSFGDSEPFNIIGDITTVRIVEEECHREIFSEISIDFEIESM